MPAVVVDRHLGHPDRLAGIVAPPLRDEELDECQPAVGAVGGDEDRLPERRLGLLQPAVAGNQSAEPHPLLGIPAILRGDPFGAGQRRRNPPRAPLQVGDDPFDGNPPVPLEVANHLLGLVVTPRRVEHDRHPAERGPLPPAKIDRPLQLADRKVAIPADLGDFAQQTRHRAPAGTVGLHLDEEMPGLLEIDPILDRHGHPDRIPV